MVNYYFPPTVRRLIPLINNNTHFTNVTPIVAESTNQIEKKNLFVQTKQKLL